MYFQQVDRDILSRAFMRILNFVADRNAATRAFVRGLKAFSFAPWLHHRRLKYDRSSYRPGAKEEEPREGWRCKPKRNLRVQSPNVASPTGMNTDKRLSRVPRCFLSTASGTNEGCSLFSRKVTRSFPRARVPFCKIQLSAREKTKFFFFPTIHVSALFIFMASFVAFILLLRSYKKVLLWCCVGKNY